MFRNVFPCSSSFAYYDSRLKAVLSANAADSGTAEALAKNCVAALLNCRSGRMTSSNGTTILLDTDVVRMWNEGRTGAFQPMYGNSSIVWGINSPTTPLMIYGGGGIIGYLKTTWS